MQGRYEPATIGEEAVGTWGRFTFHFQPGPPERVRKALDRYLRELSPEVEAGNAAAQYITGILHSFTARDDKDGRDRERRSNELIERAARSGMPDAQFYYGMLLAPSCEAGSDPGRYWIHQAAASGVSNAELWLGSALLSDFRTTPERLEPALFWLERAATSKTPSALRALARALLRSPTPDYTRVLRIAEDIADRHAYDPSVYLLRAQAYAALGQFPKAVEAQTQAIKRAKAIGWKLQPLERDLEAYRNGRAASAPDDISEPGPGS